jgi:hypothetical protein
LPGTELAQAERAQDELSATSEPANIDELADIKDIAEEGFIYLRSADRDELCRYE